MATVLERVYEAIDLFEWESGAKPGGVLLHPSDMRELTADMDRRASVAVPADWPRYATLDGVRVEEHPDCKPGAVFLSPKKEAARG